MKGSYISLQRRMSKLYLETNRNADVQIIFKFLCKLCSWVLTHLGDEVMSKISTKIVLKSQQKNLKVNLPSEGAAACSFSVSGEK